MLTSLLTCSKEEYFATERASELKHEFIDGYIRPMTGFSSAHCLITTNIACALHPLFKHIEEDVFVSRMRTKVVATEAYVYPDVVTTAGKAKCEDERCETLLNPKAIFEVLAESTEAFDRGRKFEHYRQIESLREYALVAQDRPHIDLFTRGDDHVWRLSEATGLDASIELSAIDCRLRLADVYAKVGWSASEATGE